MTEKEKRTGRINMKVLPSVKAIAEENAAADGRTLSNYIEKLIKTTRNDVQRAKNERRAKRPSFLGIIYSKVKKSRLNRKLERFSL